MIEEYNINLPKWSGLIVEGQRVTNDQVKEIIIRTDSFYFSSNDHLFVNEIYNLLYGVDNSNLCHQSLADYFKTEEGKTDYKKASELERKKREELGILKLDYLTNSRIVSSWIGGPKGWCSWDGFIGCSNYNIGKYPSVQEVHNEWEIIAKAFPFLNLRCQLLDKEIGEEGNPVVEFDIKDGKVEVHKPTSKLMNDNFDMQTIALGILNPYRERGCTINQLKDAIEYVQSLNLTT